MSEENKNEDADSSTPEEGAKKSTSPKVHWDDSGLTTSYANVVNAAATQEEVTVFFGTNQTWNVRTENELTIKLTERVILNPLAAKRLFILLGSVLKDYEARYGALDIKGSVRPGE